MRRWWVIAGVAVVCATGFGQSTEPGTTTTAGHNPAFFDDLMTHMQLVAQAQRDLKMVTPAEREKLRSLAGAATDPEVKAQLTARLAELDEEAALNPEPLSLDVQDASLPDVADALQKALGVEIHSWPARGQGGKTLSFTLKCEGKGFWDIFTQLSEQNGLMVQPSNGLMIEGSQQGLHRFFPASSGCAVFAQSLRRSSVVDPQRPAGKQVEKMGLTLRYSAAIDPRIKVAKVTGPSLDEVKDDAEHDLLAGAPGSPEWGQEAQAGQILFERTANLAMPPGMGKKVRIARGHWTMTVVLAEDEVEVNPVEVLNKPVKIGESVATISSWKVEGESIQFQMQSMGYDGGPGMGVSFVDANGKQVWSGRLQGGIGGGAGGKFVEPLKVKFTAARKSKQVTVPFEMKDLPLP